MPSPKPSFLWEGETHKSEIPLLERSFEKGDIVMKYIDIERQLADIFTKPLDTSRFAALRGELGVCNPYGLVRGGACALSCIYSILFLSHYISSYLPNLSIVSPIILACIWLIMLLIMLG
jgi:hypothetical protein